MADFGQVWFGLAVDSADRVKKAVPLRSVLPHRATPLPQGHEATEFRHARREHILIEVPGIRVIAQVLGNEEHVTQFDFQSNGYERRPIRTMLHSVLSDGF